MSSKRERALAELREIQRATTPEAIRQSARAAGDVSETGTVWLAQAFGDLVGRVNTLAAILEDLLAEDSPGPPARRG